VRTSSNLKVDVFWVLTPCFVVARCYVSEVCVVFLYKDECYLELYYPCL